MEVAKTGAPGNAQENTGVKISGSALSAPYMLFLYLYAVFMGRLLILCFAQV